MIVYLDTNSYISAKYIFDRDKFEILTRLIENNKITLIYTSATIGEVEQHIRSDMNSAISNYNRLLRKEMKVVQNICAFNIRELNKEEVVNQVIERFRLFIGMENANEISLNPIDCEGLMEDYFNQNPPFESKKPNEFKDAIMINAIRNYKSTINESICIVSNDCGFINAFTNDNNYNTFRFLSEFLRFFMQSEEGTNYVSEILSTRIKEGIFDYIIMENLSEYDVYRYGYDEYNVKINSIDDFNLEPYNIENSENDFKFKASVEVEVFISIDLSYRDEENSYYDKNSESYLIENKIQSRENHIINLDMSITFEFNKETETINNFCVIGNEDHFDLDEDTLIDSIILENSVCESSDIEYCSECGAIIGRKLDFEYSDYHGNPICENCMTGDENGQICPNCGRKVPNEYMMSGFCIDCDSKM